MCLSIVLCRLSVSLFFIVALNCVIQNSVYIFCTLFVTNQNVSFVILDIAHMHFLLQCKYVYVKKKKKSCVDENLRTEACYLILFVKMLLCIWLFKTCTVFTCKHLTHRWWKYEPVRILSNVLSHTFFSANWCKFADVCLKMLCTFL